MFDDLGIIERVVANGQMAMPIRSTSFDGRVSLGGTETLGDHPGIPYPAPLITPEWRIEEALRSRLTDLGGTVEFGTTLQRFEQSVEGVSAAVLKGDLTERVTTRWLVGCDGGHSTVRKRAGIAFDGETREDVRMIVADLAVDGLDRGTWHMWQHQDGLAALCPLPSTAVFQFQAGIAPGQDAGLSLANMQAILDRRSGRTDIRLREPEWASLWRANIRLVDRYREGRVLLAGDAAHIHSPADGQGTNTGIQDAHNLGWKLAAVVKGARTALLDSYEAERRPVAVGVLALSNARLKQAMDQKAMPTRRDASTMQLGIGYRDSVLTCDDRCEAAGLRAGDRALDATGLMTADGACRLFDLTRGGRFTLLNFGLGSVNEALPLDLRLLQVVEHPTGRNEIVDAQGHLARGYEAIDRTLVLIRPDGYVGLISDAGDVGAVAAYLATIG